MSAIATAARRDQMAGAMADAKETLIAVERVSKRYRARDGRDVEAIAEMSFGVKEGEFASVVGPSGCGKSTLLKIVAGLLPPSKGKVLFRGAAVIEPLPSFGMVFQEAILFPWRSVLRNVELPIEVLKLDRALFAPRAKELLGLVGLESFADKYPHELSGGMQQRVAIARALVQDPAILLMDEPFGALDAMTREQMALELQRIWYQARKTVLFVTHSIAEAVFLSDRVLVMSGRPAEIKEVVHIDLPRPRNIEMTASGEFGAYVTHIRRLFSLKGDL